MNAELQTNTYSNIAATNTVLAAVIAGKRKLLVTGFTCFNPGLAVCFIQLFDALVADVILGTTLPKFVIPLPPGGGIDGPNGPHVFGTAITIAVTATIPGAGVPGAPVIVQFNWV
jgi:hypothetical protein